MLLWYKYNGCALWWAIYRILIGHQSDTYDWLLIYIIYTTGVDVHMDIYQYNNKCTYVMQGGK